MKKGDFSDASSASYRLALQVLLRKEFLNQRPVLDQNLRFEDYGVVHNPSSDAADALRSTLRRRHNTNSPLSRQYVGVGSDHQRWPR